MFLVFLISVVSSQYSISWVSGLVIALFLAVISLSLICVRVVYKVVYFTLHQVYYVGGCEVIIKWIFWRYSESTPAEFTSLMVLCGTCVVDSIWMDKRKIYEWSCDNKEQVRLLLIYTSVFGSIYWTSAILGCFMLFSVCFSVRDIFINSLCLQWHCKAPFIASSEAALQHACWRCY